MQNLWAKVAQISGSCRCPQCVSVARGVAGRRTTSFAGQRAPRYSTSSTLWLSGVFAVGATFDANVKKQRREQWDNAIADVKKELRHTDDTASNATEPAVTTDPSAAYSPSFLKTLTGDLEANLNTSVHRADAPQWPTNSGQRLEVHNLPPQSMYASPYHKEVRARAIWSPKKLERVHLTMDVLQLELIRDLRGRGWSEDAAQSVPSAYGEKIMMRDKDIALALKSKRSDLQRLHSVDPQLNGWRRTEGDIPFCNYVQDEKAGHRLATVKLNHSLQNLFKLNQDEKLSKASLLAKVAHNLAVSTAPPDVDTYNTLILGFWRAREDEQTLYMINAFHQSYARPNEVTLAAILGFYTDIGDVDKFTDFFALMRGRRGGLMRAHPDTQITDTGRPRLIPRLHADHKIVQLPHPTPLVFGALINGVLKFSGFDTARKACETMGREGWGLCMAGLTPLLQDCARRGDWDAGSAVWAELCRLQKLGRSTETISLQAHVAALKLCAKHEKETEFDEVMESFMKRYPEEARRTDELLRKSGKASDIWDTLLAGTNASLSRSTIADMSREIGKLERSSFRAERSSTKLRETPTEVPVSLLLPHTAWDEVPRQLASGDG